MGMKLPLSPGLVLLTLVLMSVPACNDSTPTGPTAPETLTETFTGTVTLGAVATHVFVVRAEGTVVITLLGVQPPSPEEPLPEGEPPPPIPPLGLAVGTWNGVSCSRVAKNDAAIPGTTLSGRALPGDFCVDVYDTGNLSAETAYALSVVHP